MQTALQAPHVLHEGGSARIFLLQVNLSTKYVRSLQSCNGGESALWKRCPHLKFRIGLGDDGPAVVDVDAALSQVESASSLHDGGDEVLLHAQL